MRIIAGKNAVRLIVMTTLIVLVLLRFPDHGLSQQSSIPTFHELLLPPCTYPGLAESIAGIRVGELVFRGLYGYDRQNRLAGVLAADPAIFPEEPQASYTIRLKPGMYWPANDGSASNVPVTAADVKFTFDALSGSGNVPFGLDRFEQKIKRINVIDDRTIEFTFASADPFVRRIFRTPILPAHLLRQSQLTRNNPFFERPVGTGPFTLTQYDKLERRLELRRNGAYAGNQPQLHELRIQEITYPETAFNELTLESIHFMPEVPPNQAAYLRNQIVTGSPFSARSYNTAKIDFIALNTKNPHLRKTQVRQAISHVANRVRWNQSTFTDAVPISGPIAPTSPYYNKSIRPRGFDPNAARDLLAAAGYTIGEQGGSRQLMYQGKPVEKMYLIDNREFSIHSVCLDFSETLLREIGLRVEVVSGRDQGEYESRVLGRRDFDMAYMTMDMQDYTDLAPLFDSRYCAGNGLNFIQYTSPRLDDLFEQHRTASSVEQAHQIYFKIHEHLAEECPYVYLWSRTNFAAWNTRVLPTVDLWSGNVYGGIEYWRRGN